MTGSKGITLIELLVGITCFSIVVVLVAGIFVTSLKAKKQMQELSVLQDEARYIMDYMTREIRVTDIQGGDTNNINLATDVKYKIQGTNIVRQEKIGPAQQLNSDNVKLTSNSTFNVDKTLKPSRVQIILEFQSNSNIVKVQTTISSRYYDYE